MSGLDAVRGWFASRGWLPHGFQEEAWAAYGAGKSGLVQVPTGAGKTYAAYMGPLAELIDGANRGERAAGLSVLYITPLRAVSRDVELALKEPVAELLAPVAAGLKWKPRVESRTGDTSASVRAKQRVELPTVLVTTPESLCLLLTRPDVGAAFAGLRAVILDEWHELMGSKRGSQVELALARLRRLAPRVRTWALSATLPNVEVAARAAVGAGGAEPVIVRAALDREVTVTSVLPEAVESFPWAGHLGLTMLPRVLEALDPARSTLIFTNTRSQAELWHRAIVFAKPEWEAICALHHGSIDRANRERIEAGVKSGEIRFVVATSSLDLGVDFAPVERVLQIGSPKGIARIIQRAGRGSHRPGAACEVVCVPTHGLELVEIDAARRAVERGEVEPRTPPERPLDVLAQHLVTLGLGGGFVAEEVFEEVRTAWSYRALTREEFGWTLELVHAGGATLGAYPQFKKLAFDGARYAMTDARMAQLHRFNIGTIVSEATVEVRFRGGKRLGSIEEGFVAMLRPNEKFLFAGRVLRFVELRDLVAVVKPDRGKSNSTPRWAGTKLPISESLSAAVRETLERASEGKLDSPELRAAEPIIRAQARLSRIPRADELLAEVVSTREGTHLFVYPFEGRSVHGGLAALLALRLTRREPATFSISVNDYGMELLTREGYPFGSLLGRELFTLEGLSEDAVESVNIAEIARLQFREIARVAGLVFQSYPGTKKSSRQTQASAGLIYDVFKEFDPENLLLRQARREVLERHFERGRLGRTLERLGGIPLRVVKPGRPTPLAFPLIVERVSALLSGEPLAQRIERMKSQWACEA